MTISKWYGSAFTRAFGSSGLDVAGGTLKALLCDGTYVPDQDTHDFLTDVTGELTDPSYGRVTLTGVSVTYDAATNRLVIDSDPYTFTALDDTFRFAVLFLDTGTAATSPLVKYTDFEANQVASAVDVTITPNATDGLAKVTVA